VDEEEALAGGWSREVHRRDDVVLRSPGPQSATVLALLRHLREQGVTFVPEPVGDGFAPDGREQLRFIDGRSPQPHAWSDEAVGEIGRMLRQVHDASDGFELPPGGRWRERFTSTLAGRHPVIGHGDLGPWNVLARGGGPVAFIDWATPHPSTPSGTWPRQPG
jgi:Ser/Thr protein kinase RdoA (MazF antagonist)